MINREIIACCILLFINTFRVLAQEYTISGKVTEEQTGDPLVGVNIVVKGLVIGTITDIDGNYKLTVKQDLPFTIQFS